MTLSKTPLLMCLGTLVACGNAPSGASIEVLSARQADGFAAADDNLLQLDVRLTNTSASAIPLSPLLFKVKTRDGLLIPPRLDSQLRWVGGSQPPASVELAPGATFAHLELGFEVRAADAISLEYVLPVVSSSGEVREPASAPLSIESCAA